MDASYELNACVAPKFVYWNSDAQNDSSGWSLWEVLMSRGGALVNEINALIEETPQSSQVPLHLVMIQWEICDLKEGFHPDYAHTLISELWY